MKSEINREAAAEMAQTVTLLIEEARALVAAALRQSNVSAPNAEIVAQALVDAEVDGQFGHGLRRVASYAAQAAAGKVDGHAVPVVQRPAAGVLRVDAAHGFAFPALEKVYEELPVVTRQNGVGLAGIYNSHHCGVAGHAVERLANAGFIALMFANTPAAMAPWGGKKRLFGTNPVAFAAPLPDAPPIVVDLSLSRVARGKIVAAKEKGERIPEGWALGPDGEPTTDPARAVAGSMLPIGDAKGAALALMVELLAAGLTGGKYAFEASSFLDAEGPPPDTGQLILAISPEPFGKHDVLARFAAMADAIRGDGSARLPGSRCIALRQRARAQGLIVEQSVLDAIRQLAGGHTG